MSDDPIKNEGVYLIESVSNDLGNNPGRLLRAKAAMEYLGLSRATFYRYIELGFIPRQKYLGGLAVWRLNDLQKFTSTKLSDRPLLTPEAELPTKKTRKRGRPRQSDLPKG